VTRPRVPRTRRRVRGTPVGSCGADTPPIKTAQPTVRDRPRCQRPGQRPAGHGFSRGTDRVPEAYAAAAGLVSCRPATRISLPAIVAGLGLPRMPLRLRRERTAELTADPPPRGQQAATAAASFVSPDSATRGGLGSSTDAIAALRGRPFSCHFPTAREQIYEHRPNAKDIYYPAAPHGITPTYQDQVNADMLAFWQN